MNRRSLLLPLAGLLALSAACARKPRIENVLLVSLDTTRADYVDSGRGSRAWTPELRRFGAGAWVFENAFTTIPQTLPAHLAMLSGRLPHELGVFGNEYVYDGRWPMLQQVLQRRGWRTAGIVSLGTLAATTGIARGFDRYEDRLNDSNHYYAAAEKVTPAIINFMARNGRGLICLSLTRRKAQELDLPPMVGNNTSRYGTGFTVSVDARCGITGGVSAADRATTILTAVADSARPQDLVRPGHVFPLMAREGGVIVRTGQTEGSVDLARLAGLTPAGVICAIMDEDGSMAKIPALEKLSDTLGIGICSIPDLIEYRMRTESFVHRVAEAAVPTVIAGDFRAIVYENDIDNLIRAKGAIFSGYQTLLEEVGLTMDMIEHIILAGGFGSYIDLDRAMTIGLLPEIEADRVTFIGNGSLLGARMSSLTKRIRKDVVEVTKRMTNFELSETPSYMSNYVAAMFLPHTEIEKFPRTKGRIEGRGRQ